MAQEQVIQQDVDHHRAEQRQRKRHVAVHQQECAACDLDRAYKEYIVRLEEQIQELAVPVIAHRLVMEPQARFSGQTARGVVEEVLKKIRVPA